MAEHHAYLQLMLDSARGRRQFDIVHNNSLHYLPVAMAAAVPTPMVTTLHTPPTPWLESAIQARRACGTFAAVSAHTAGAWRHLVRDPVVIRNGVDLDGGRRPGRWPAGLGRAARCRRRGRTSPSRPPGSPAGRSAGRPDLGPGVLRAEIVRGSEWTVIRYLGHLVMPSSRAGGRAPARCW